MGYTLDQMINDFHKKEEESKKKWCKENKDWECQDCPETICPLNKKRGGENHGISEKFGK